MQQEACVRIERTAEMAERAIDFFDQFGPPDRGARDDIGMTIQILGAAMY
jgi:hypothetical protein